MEPSDMEKTRIQWLAGVLDWKVRKSRQQVYHHMKNYSCLVHMQVLVPAHMGILVKSQVHFKIVKYLFIYLFIYLLKP